MSHSEDNDKWVFPAHWKTMQEAKAAAEAAETAEANTPMLSLIDMENMVFLHAEPAVTPVSV